VSGYVYHVLNRANGRLRIFRKEGDFLAFEKILADGAGIRGSLERGAGGTAVELGPTGSRGSPWARWGSHRQQHPAGLPVR
jgi:hypothetical protein